MVGWKQVWCRGGEAIYKSEKRVVFCTKVLYNNIVLKGVNMTTRVIDSSNVRKDLSTILNMVKNDKEIVLVKRHGKVESAVVNIDEFEDMLATQNPKYLKSIADARKSKEWYTPEEVFGGVG